MSDTRAARTDSASSGWREQDERVAVDENGQPTWRCRREEMLSMKGYELYSWPAGQDWDFALMIGTNRIKTLDEIQSPEQTLHGVEAIKTALRGLPVDEQVFWEGQGWIRESQVAAGSIVLPPAPIRDEITGLCSQLGIRLTVDE